MDLTTPDVKSDGAFSATHDETPSVSTTPATTEKPRDTDNAGEKPTKTRKRRDASPAARKTRKKAQPAAPEPDPRPLFRFGVRPLESSETRWFPAEDNSRSGLAAALTNALNAVVPWKRDVLLIGDGSDSNRDLFAAVDIDYHGSFKPDRDRLDIVALMCPITPFARWITHGVGYRMLFLPYDPFTAGELAACAAFWMQQRLTSVVGAPTGIEIVGSTRHPRYPRGDGATAGGVSFPYPCAPDIRVSVGRLLGEAAPLDADEIDEWREEHGFTGQARYSHVMCPIDPTPGDDKRSPVFAGDIGIFCIRCRDKGLTFPGCRQPGIAPYSLLNAAGGARRDATSRAWAPIRSLVENVTHWSHAQHVFNHYVPGHDRAHEYLYRALLKLWHYQKAPSDPKAAAKYLAGVDKLIRQVFFPPVPLLRGNRVWLLADDPTTVAAPQGLASQLRCMSGVKYVERETGEIRIDPLRLSRAQGNGDLKDIGLPALTPIGGIDLTGIVGDIDRAGDAGGMIPFITPIDPPFRRRTAAGRARGDHWRQVESNFPSIHRNYLKLLIGAIAVNQLQRRDEPIIIAVEGQSGAAKTATALLAAELTGTAAAKVKFDRDRTRFLNAIDNAGRSGFAILDECAKSGLQNGELAGLILDVQRNVRRHQLNVGAVSLSQLPVMLFLDTQLPHLFRTDVQIRRRTTYVGLEAGAVGSRDWWETSDGGVRGWRARPWCTTAADSIVSEVMDELDALRNLNDPFKAFAEKLGFFTLAHKPTEEGQNTDINDDAPLLALFDAAGRAPDCSDEKSQWRGKGWRVFTRGNGSELATAWAELAPHGGDVDSQLVTGAQWGVLTGVAGLVCDLRQHGQKIGIRFRVGSARSPSVRYGFDVLPDDDARRTVAATDPPPAPPPT